MHLELSLEPPDILLVHLREGDEHTIVSVRPAQAGAETLLRTVDAAIMTGYGECFWPATTGGQYWWIFSRECDTLESIAMWTRGGASGWEHVFRATDAAAWVRERISGEVARLGLGVAPAGD